VTTAPPPVRSPEETARLAAETMWASDAACRNLGIAILAVGPGTATLALTVTDTMVNGHDIAHGGYLFTLADSAFAYACNSYGLTTVASHGSITFIRPGRRGDRLVATAREVSRSARSGLYDAQIRVGDVVIAEFRGHSRTVGGSFIDGGDPASETPTP
jgi:acyl-CoA thioesterase